MIYSDSARCLDAVCVQMIYFYRKSYSKEAHRDTLLRTLQSSNVLVDTLLGGTVKEIMLRVTMIYLRSTRCLLSVCDNDRCLYLKGIT